MNSYEAESGHASVTLDDFVGHADQSPPDPIFIENLGLHREARLVDGRGATGRNAAARSAGGRSTGS